MSLFNSIGQMCTTWYDWGFSKIWILESSRNDVKVNVYRQTLWPDISGKVLEIGPGYAQSLKLLQHKTLPDGTSIVDPAVVKSYTALEPNEFLYKGLQKNAEVNGFRVEYDRQCYPDCKEQDTIQPRDGLSVFKIVRGTLDSLDKIPESILRDAPYDSIVTSFMLCTCKDPDASLDGIFKLLRPGGTYYFIEHVRQPEPNHPSVIADNGVYAKFWGSVQDWINPLWNVVAHGCHLNRRTGEKIAAMKCWKSVNYCHVRPVVDIQSRIMPLAFGRAIKPDE